MIRYKWYIVVILAILLNSGIAFQMGRTFEKSTNPVCFAKAEDSDISGCDYRNGAWYRK